MRFVAPVGERNDGNAAAGHEDASHFYIFGFHEFYEVFHYDIDAVLVEISMISEAEQIEFQTLTLYHSAPGM